MIFVLLSKYLGKNQRQSSFIKHFLFVIQRQDLRSKTLRSKITFEHMIRPFKWFLWMKVAQPVHNVEKSERRREQDSRNGIDFARAISRPLTSGFQQTGPSIFLQAYKIGIVIIDQRRILIVWILDNFNFNWAWVNKMRDTASILLVQLVDL